ncbi:MAG: CpaE family protein [Gemmobacter sp.]
MIVNGSATAHGRRSVLILSPKLAVAETLAEGPGQLPDTEVETSAARVSGIAAAPDARAAHRGVPVLATDGTECAADDVTPVPAAPVRPEPVLAEAAQEPAAQLPVPFRRGQGRPGRLFAVTRARGGMGATTVAVNLAEAFLGKTGILRPQPTRDVVIVDLDFQFGNVATFLDSDDRGAMLKLALADAARHPEVIDSMPSAHASGLRVLPAPAEAAPLDVMTPAAVASLIDALLDRNAIVVVDLPRVLVDWIDPVLSRAAALVMVTDTSVPSIRHARRIIDVMTEEHPGLPVEIVVNRETRPFIGQRRHMSEAAEALRHPLSHWLPDDPRAARAAIDRGAPLSEVAPRSALTKAIGKLSQELARKYLDQQAAVATSEVK